MASLEPRRISELEELTSLENNDLIAAVDSGDNTESASGTTKRATFSNLKQSIFLDLNISNWDAAYGWGNHADAGYISNFTETDPVFTASPAHSITELNKTNWTTAYSWGNHSTAGYLTSYTETDPVFQASAAAGITVARYLTWDTAYGWGDHSTEGYLKDIANFSFNDLNDSLISNVQNGQYLKWNGSRWINFTPNFLENFQESDTLQTVTTRGATTDVDCTFSGITITGNLSVAGTTTQNNVTTLNVSNNEIVINNGQSSGALNALIKNDRGSDADVAIRWNEASDRWQFTNDGTNYFNLAFSTSDLVNNSGFLTAMGSLQSLSNVTIQNPAAEQGLLYNGSEWVNTTLDFNTRVFISTGAPASPVSGNLWWDTDDEILKVYYNTGSNLQWVNVSSGVGSGGGISSYASIAFFPAVADNIGKMVFNEANTSMYYSDGASWTNNRLVTTTSTETSDLATIIGNSQLTYSISTLDYTTGSTADFNDARKIIRLSSSAGVQDDIVLRAGNGLTISKDDDEITFNVNFSAITFGLSAVEATGTNSKLRLTGSDGSTDDVTFAGADGISVERTTDSVITIRYAPAAGTEYTDEDAQDAAAAMLVNGSHTNISFVYNDATNTIDATASGGGGNGGGAIYSLDGSNTTSNNAIITLTGTDSTSDAIEIAGGGGTSINWDGANSKIEVSSTAPVQSDWNASSGLAQILNKPTIPPAYTLPIATGSVLGGIKVGANLTINPTTGVLDANPGSYTLPAATSSTLGGIKIGTGLSIDNNGVVTVSQGGGTPLQTRSTITKTTSSLSPHSFEEVTFTNGFKTYSLFKLTTSEEAWVRIYVDQASMQADRTRSEGNDPGPGSGVIAEARVNGTQLFTPVPTGLNNDNPVSNNIYASITNRGSSATTIDVTLTLLRLEA